MLTHKFLICLHFVQVMRDGKITQSGKYNDILNSGTDFMELVGAHREALSAINSLERKPTSKELSIITVDNNTDSLSEFGLDEKKVESKEDVQNSKADDTDDEPVGHLVQEEEREKGKVGFEVYWKYITTAHKGALVPFIVFFLVLFQVLQIGSNYWMASATPASATMEPPVESFTLMIVFVVLAIGSSFCNIARLMLLYVAGYKTATILFNKLHLCFFRAPMSFFDATPSGRILNRVCQDKIVIYVYP